MEKWIDQSNIELSDIDTNQSTKTNFKICGRNFLSILTEFINVKTYLKELTDLINIDNILENLLSLLTTDKPIINILVNLGVGESQTTTFKSTQYQLTKVDLFTVRINNLTNTKWNVDKLIVCVKDYNGVIVYPVITTSNNNITINFAEGMKTNYNVIFI